MEIMQVKDSDVPPPMARIDYRKIAEAFNELPVGRTLRLDPVYNITVFRRTLERRAPSGSFEVFQRRGNCFLKRVTADAMEVV